MSNNSTDETLHSLNDDPAFFTDSLSPTSVLNWLHTLQTPPQTSDYLPLLAATPTPRSSKWCWDGGGSTLSEDRKDTELSRKKRRVFRTMADDASEQAPARSGPSVSSNQLGNSSNKSLNSPTKIAAPLVETSVRKRQITNERDIGEIMEDHGMIFEDREAFMKYSDFVDKVKTIVYGDRSSPQSQKSAERFEKFLHVYERMNESTLLQNVFPILMGNGYHLLESTACKEHEEPQMAEDRRKYVDFLLDEGIITTMDWEFRRTLVPSRHIKDEEQFIGKMAKHLEKYPGMKNPKPDYALVRVRGKLPEWMYPCRKKS